MHTLIIFLAEWERLFFGGEVETFIEQKSFVVIREERVRGLERGRGQGENIKVRTSEISESTPAHFLLSLFKTESQGVDLWRRWPRAISNRR